MHQGESMKAIVQMFIDDTDGWEAQNPRLYEAVWGIEKRADGSRLLKIGMADPATPGMALRWNDLPYVDETNIQGLSEHLAAIVAAYTQGLQQEAEARSQADAQLQSNITQETSARQQGDTQEAEARSQADAQLQSNITQETTARQQGDTQEAEARETGDTQEAQTRQQADEQLQLYIGEVDAETDSNRFAFEYLLQFIEAKLGPLDAIAIATESGDVLVTESGNRIVV
jgi:hypothetical protein